MTGWRAAMIDYRTLVSVDALARHLDDPDWRVVDTRFSLADPYLFVVSTWLPGDGRLQRRSPFGSGILHFRVTPGLADLPALMAGSTR